MKCSAILGFALVLSGGLLGCSTTQQLDSSNAEDTCKPRGIVLSRHRLYGTTSGAGLDFAAVFKMNMDGTGFAILHKFSWRSYPDNTNLDGDVPMAGLVLSGDTLYGTTSEGGNTGCGTVFKVRTSGKDFAVLHHFHGPDGCRPLAALVLSGQTLFGTTQRGGINGGIVFKVNTDGTDFAILHTFSRAGGTECTNSDGSFPQSELVLSGQTLYGTAWSGGDAGQGTVFKVNTNGDGFAVLHDFGAGSSRATNFGRLTGHESNHDGGFLESGLVLWDGQLYGTASHGGNAGNGTLFKMSTDGTGFSVLHSFLPVDSTTNSDGSHPRGLFRLGNTLYGTASEGGATGWGAMFKVNSDGSDFTILPVFPQAGLSGPVTGMIQSGGALFGTTEFGGPEAGGIVFKINPNGTEMDVLHSFIEKPLPPALTD